MILGRQQEVAYAKLPLMKVVICGGGFAGTKVALSLANKPGIDVTFLVNNENFEYHGALYRSATGRSPLEVVIPHRETFKDAKNVEVILEEVKTVDHVRRQVIGNDGDIYTYDVAVFALGNVINYFGIDGMAKNSFSMNTIPQTIALRHELVRHLKTESEHPLKVAIIGAGPTGVELAGELNNFAKLVSKKYSLKHVRKVKVELIEGAGQVLPSMGPVVGHKAGARLEKLGVELNLNCKVNLCEPGKVCLDSRDIMANVIVWTAGAMPVNFYSRHEKFFELERGRAKVDNYLQAVGHENVFVIGDNSATIYSGMAWSALHQAIVTARNIIHLQHDKPMTKYIPHPPTYVVPIGPSWAVYKNDDRVKTGRAGWLVKRRADLEVFKAFQPYETAVKKWRRSNKRAEF
jgi:NADH:ubiquinone reductase (H+-translocating)